MTENKFNRLYYNDKTTLDDFCMLYNQFCGYEDIAKMLEASSTREKQKSIIADTIIFKMLDVNCKGNETVKFSYGEAYLAIGLDKDLLAS